MITIRDFYTSKCVPCQRLAPILEKIANENDDVKLIKIDCETNLELAIAEGIRAVPVLIIESEDGDTVRLNGMQTEASILKEIDLMR
jgi:thioredoxin 1